MGDQSYSEWLLNTLVSIFPPPLPVCPSLLQLQSQLSCFPAPLFLMLPLQPRTSHSQPQTDKTSSAFYCRYKKILVFLTKREWRMMSSCCHLCCLRPASDSFYFTILCGKHFNAPLRSAMRIDFNMIHCSTSQEIQFQTSVHQIHSLANTSSNGCPCCLRGTALKTSNWALY